jgi:predicted TIM-barrel fold metal-dependent hydrolase
MQDEGVRAVRIFPPRRHLNLAVETWGPLAAALEAAAIPLILDLERRHWAEQSPWDEIFALARAFPRLPLVLLREWGTTERLLYPSWESYPHIYLEMSYMQGACGWEDTIAAFGHERLLFGTGMPQYAPGGPLGSLRGSRLTEQQRQDIAGDNARRLLGLQPAAAPVSADWPVGPDGYRVWDIHGHLGVWDDISTTLSTADQLVARMDETGVERIVVSHLLGVANDAETANSQAIEAARRHPTRLQAYAAFSPHEYHGREQEFAALLERPEVAGIKLHDFHGVPMDSPLYEPVYRMAGEYGLPLLSHGCPPVRYLANLLERYPRLSYLSAHAAGGRPGEVLPLVELAADYPALYLDTTSSVLPYRGLEELLKQVSAQQIVYGSDTPLMDFPFQLGRIIYADIDEEDKRSLLWENAARLFAPRSQVS